MAQENDLNEDAAPLDQSLDQLADATHSQNALQQRRLRKEKRVSRKSVSHGRVSLLIVAVLFALTALFYLGIGLTNEDLITLIESAVYGVLAAGFVILYAWGRRQPYPALVTGLSLVAALWLLDIAVAILTNPINVTNGLLPRVVIVFFLVRGVLSAKKQRRMKLARV